MNQVTCFSRFAPFTDRKEFSCHSKSVPLFAFPSQPRLSLPRAPPVTAVARWRAEFRRLAEQRRCGRQRGSNATVSAAQLRRWDRQHCGRCSSGGTTAAAARQHRRRCRLGRITSSGGLPATGGLPETAGSPAPAAPRFGRRQLETAGFQHRRRSRARRHKAAAAGSPSPAAHLRRGVTSAGGTTSPVRRRK